MALESMASTPIPTGHEDMSLGWLWLGSEFEGPRAEVEWAPWELLRELDGFRERCQVKARTLPEPSQGR